MKVTAMFSEDSDADAAFAAMIQFAKKVAPQVEKWIGRDGKLCIIALPVDGGVYAYKLNERLTERLSTKPERIYMTPDGQGLQEAPIEALKTAGFSFLMVDNDTITGGTVEKIREFLISLGVNYQHIKLALYTDRVGSADFICEVTAGHCYRCGRKFREYSNKPLHRGYCNTCLPFARSEIARIKRVFRGAGESQLSFDEIVAGVNAQAASRSFSKRRVESYLTNPILFEEVEERMYRIRRH